MADPSIPFPSQSSNSSHLARRQYTTEPQIQERQLVPEMAVDRADKENLPPSVAPAAAAAAIARLHVKSCKQKRLGRARRRVPLRDITNLFALEPEWQQTLTLVQQPREGSATAEPAVKQGLAGGAGSKAGRYSLRKEFR